MGHHYLRNEDNGQNGQRKANQPYDVLHPSYSEGNLLSLEVSLKVGRANQRREVITDRIDISVGGAHGDTDVQVHDSFPGGRLRRRKRQSSREFGQVPRDPAERSGPLGRSPSKRQVVFDRLRLQRADVTYGILAEGVSIEGLGVDSKCHMGIEWG